MPKLLFSQFGHILEQYCIAMNDHNFIWRCVLILTKCFVLGSTPSYFAWWWESHKNILHGTERVNLQIII